MKKTIHAACLGAAIVIAACNTKDTAPNSADSSAVPPAVATPATNDNATIASYTLDMDKIQKLTAFMNNAAAYKKTHPGEDIDVSMDASDNLETAIQRIEANATARDLLQKSGLTARDYVLTISAYLGAGMTAAMLNSNPNAKIPEGVNPQNVEFIRTHKTELEQIKKALEENDR